MRRLAVALATVLFLPAGAHAAFPGENGRLVYPSFSEHGLWTARPDMSHRRPLVRIPWAGEAAWSADGRRVVFTASRGEASHSDVYSIRADGARLRRLTRTAANESSPSWSPDGRRIAFTRTNRGTARSGLWVMRADGTRQRRLTGEFSGASWAPDGSVIAYIGLDREIHTIDPRTRADRQVTHEPEGRLYAADPDWSPDSRRIAYLEIAECAACDGNYSLAQVRRDGTHQHALDFQRGASWRSAPHWSPDGRFISYCQGGFTADAGLWRMHPNGRFRHHIARFGCQAAWQPRP